MSQENQHTNNEKKQKKGFVGWLMWLVKFLFKTFLVFLAFILFIAISSYMLFQFEGFRGWLSSKVSNIASEQLEAKLEFDDIDINIFKGIGLENVRMTTRGDTLALIENLYLTFQIKPFLNNNVKISNLILEKPKIKLLRSADSSWNYDYIAKPSDDEDTTASEPSNWIIELDNFEIHNGSFIMYDSTSTAKMDFNHIDFKNIYLERLNIDLSAKLETIGPIIEAKVENISFIEERTFFNLKSLMLDAEISPERIRINDLAIETDKSEFSIEGSLDSINIFAEDDIGDGVITFELQGDKININDIRHFAQIDYPLSKVFEVILSASGSISELNIDELNLKTGRTWINMMGKLYNLDGSKDFLYDMSINDSRVYHSDLIQNLPKDTRKSINDFGFVDITIIDAKGNDKYVTSKLNISNKFGSVSGKARVDFAGLLKFDADIAIRRFNPSELLNDPALKGIINAKIKAKGSGSNIKDIQGKVELIAENSSFTDYKLSYLNTSITANGNSEFILDTLYLELIKESHDSFDELFGDSKPFISSSGMIDMSESEPEYDLSIIVKNINSDDLFNNENLPQLFSGSADITGSGFELDKIQAKVHTSIQDAMFEDRGLMPFDIDITMRRDSGDYKELLIDSDLLSLFLNGDFSYNNFISQISKQGVYLEKFIKNKINSFYQYSSGDTLLLPEKIGSFEPVDLSLEMKLFDLSPISPFLGNTEIYANSSFDIDLYVTEDRSDFLINGINISSLQIKQSTSSINIRPTQISGALFMSLKDSMPKLERMSLDLTSDFDVSIDDLALNKPRAKIVFADSTAVFYISISINDMIGFKTEGNLIFKPDKFFTQLDSLSISWQDIATWRNISPVLADITQNEYLLNQLILQRDSSEIIDISGSLKNDSLITLDLIATNFPFSDINTFVKDSQQEILKEVKSGLDTLDLHLEGTFSDPSIDLSIKTDEIVLRNKSAGRFISNFIYKKGKMSGFADIRKSQYDSIKKLFEVKVGSLPVNLSLTNDSSIIHSRYPFDIKAFAKDFPIVLLEPFAAVVRDLNGTIDLNVDLFGKSYDDMGINGNLKIFKNTSFVLSPINMKYLINGEINFNQDKINIEKIELKNNYEDYSRGKALISGDLTFDDFEFKNFNIEFKTDGLKVLSDASRKSLKSLYGNLIINTGKNPIRLFGSLKEPNIKGNLNIIRGNLTLAQTKSAQEIESNVKYEIKGSRIEVNAINKDLLKNIGNDRIEENNDTEDKNSIINRLNVDLYASILSRFVFNMDLGLLGQLYAEIGMADKTVPLHLVMERNKKEPQISGELKLEEGSRLNYLKLFKTTGTISFPTGAVEDPELDLTAIYNGKTFIDNEIKDFRVFLYIKGTMDRLNFRFDYSIDGIRAIGDSSEIAQDAILLLLTGKTTAQWRSGGGQQTDVVGGSIVSSAASPLLSQAATELLQGTVGIENAEIDLSTGWDNARMQLTGRIAGDVVWRFGGTIADFSQNNEITIDIPLPLVIHKDYLNNIILQLTQATNVSQTATRNQKKWEVKLKFGGSW